MWEGKFWLGGSRWMKRMTVSKGKSQGENNSPWTDKYKASRTNVTTKTHSTVINCERQINNEPLIRVIRGWYYSAARGSGIIFAQKTTFYWIAQPWSEALNFQYRHAFPCSLWYYLQRCSSLSLCWSCPDLSILRRTSSSYAALRFPASRCYSWRIELEQNHSSS